MPHATSRLTHVQGLRAVAVLAVVLGALTYALLLNPVTYEPAGWFRYVTASLPAFCGPGLRAASDNRSFVLCTKNRPRSGRQTGRGARSQRAGPRPIATRLPSLCGRHQSSR